MTMAAAKRVVDKKESLKEIYDSLVSESSDLFNEIDNWSARIHSLQKLATSRTVFTFKDIFKFLEIFNFLSGEFDLLYHGKIEVGGVSHERDGYSHDFLRGHLAVVKNRINRVSNDNPLKQTMRHTHISAELNFVSKGTILVDGLNLLKSIINELIKKLRKQCIKICMKETAAYTPYVVSISDENTMQHLDRYESIDFEQRLKDHPWSPVTETQVVRKKQKKEKAESSIVQKKQQYPLK
jgi:hypothetical protein